MDNKGLLFIPDISGFTRFVNEIELEHSHHIIQQLLEVLINANHLGFEISEIEGDAILFYKFGAPLEMDALYKQVETMFCEFHRHLNAYDHRKICQCKACVAAINLSLKVITHYGEFTTYQIKNFNKLIGKDVIVAHQLLKNDIEHHEYWLVTDKLFRNNKPLRLAEWIQWNTSAKQTENGDIAFHYAQLSELKNKVHLEPDPQLELSDKVKMISVSGTYNIDIKTLCYTVVHFEFRHLWQVGLKTIDEVERFLPGVGSRHRHLMTNGDEVMMCTSSFAYNPEERIHFSETDEKRQNATYYSIEKINDHQSRLTLDFYMKKNTLKQLLFKITDRARMQADMEQSLKNLEPVVMNMVVPLEF